MFTAKIMNISPNGTGIDVLADYFNDEDASHIAKIIHLEGLDTLNSEIIEYQVRKIGEDLSINLEKVANLKDTIVGTQLVIKE